MQGNDLISREAALEILMRYCPDDDGSCTKADVDPREMLDEIENLPAVDAKPVAHAKWHLCRMNVPKGHGQMYSAWRCSACHKHERKRSDYCPNCGAKMEAKHEAD